MAGKKNRRMNAYPDWEVSETDESYTNGDNHNIANPADAGGVSEREDSKGNNYTSNQAGGSRSDQGKVSSSSQPKQKVNLGPWTLAVGDTLQNLEQTQRTISNLQKMFMLHTKDLEKIDQTSTMLQQLEEDCRQKDEDLESQEKTIRTLTRMETKAKAQIEHDAAQIEKEKNELKQARERQEKRVTMLAAEERQKVNQDFDKRMRERDEIHKKRKQELEDEFAQKRDANNKRATAFEAERERLSTAVKEQDLRIKAQKEELDKIKEQYDLLERAKDSIRKEKLDREAELEAVKKEFALDTQPIDYFTHSFAEIESQIERISGKYFHDIEGKELEQVHESLAAADPFFEFVPIAESDDSCDLCAAHAQRVISKAICEDVWKPFSSEFTASHPEFSSALSKISDEIEKSDHGGRRAKFWNARTMWALKALPAISVTSQSSESTRYTHPVRTNSVISKVFVLSPLVSSSQEESLRKDLISLVNSAVDVWDNGQAGGYKITASLLLDYVHREEWRSQQFDPACEGDETNPDQTSSTRPGIFPLFPRVLAPTVGNLVNHGSGPPGSWPVESDPTIIHPGKGLPEWSPLVVRGQLEQEERKDYITKAVEDAKMRLHNKRASGSGRRSSRGSVTSGTPSEQWKRGGAR